MLKNVKNSIRFFMLSLKYNLKSVAEYKRSFIVQVLFMLFNNFFFLIYWIVIFSLNNGSLDGIEFKDVLILWAIPNGAWGIANFFFGGIREIDRLIITGGLDTYLLQPKNLILSIALAKCRFSSFGDLLYGVVMSIIISESIFEFLLLTLFMITGAMVMLSCFIIVRSLAVWLGEMENIASVYENTLLITLSTYPFNIFGNVLKVLMFTIVPTAYISHIPVMVLSHFDIKLFAIVPISALVLMIIAVKFFYMILKRYESGNNISMKI